MKMTSSNAATGAASEGPGYVMETMTVVISVMNNRVVGEIQSWKCNGHEDCIGSSNEANCSDSNSEGSNADNSGLIIEL